jgi:ABC-2 type transport system ATP-binding protein
VNVIESHRLGKRYRGGWALRDCTLAIPGGHVVALVGPNGAGKTTLLHLSVGLATPTAGKVAVLGGAVAGSPTALGRIAFVAQNAPLYKNLSAADTLRLARNLNRQWDQRYARTRLADLGIPAKKKVGSLSGGQQAQLALTLALARRPELLVLDEPLATLDPVARHDFMGTVMAAVADYGLSVVLSSHMLAELDRVADYLVVLSAGKVQVADEVDDLLSGHLMLSGPASRADDLAGRVAVVYAARAKEQVHMLVRTRMAVCDTPPGFQARPVGLEELAMGYLRAPEASALPGPARGGTDRSTEVLA